MAGRNCKGYKRRPCSNQGRQHSSGWKFSFSDEYGYCDANCRTDKNCSFAREKFAATKKCSWPKIKNPPLPAKNRNLPRWLRMYIIAHKSAYTFCFRNEQKELRAAAWGPLCLEAIHHARQSISCLLPSCLSVPQPTVGNGMHFSVLRW